MSTDNIEEIDITCLTETFALLPGSLTYARLPPGRLIASGNTQLMERCERVLDKQFTSADADSAAFSGNLKTLKWLKSKSVLPTPRAFAFAACNNHLQVVKWLHAEGIKGLYNCANAVASNGHLKMVKWLHAHGIKCTASGAFMAAQNNHMDVVQWLREHDVYSNCIVHHVIS